MGMIRHVWAVYRLLDLHPAKAIIPIANNPSLVSLKRQAPPLPLLWPGYLILVGQEDSPSPSSPLIAYLERIASYMLW
jgi:hypothetical protein